jgi:hypothetical protein
VVKVTWAERGQHGEKSRLLLTVGDKSWHITQAEGLKLLRDLQARLLYEQEERMVRTAMVPFTEGLVLRNRRRKAAR